MLNRIWLGFFVVAFAYCLYQALLGGHPEVFEQVVQATFKSAQSAVEISLGLVGVLCLWLGLFQIAERSGLIERLAWVLSPLFKRLMPEVPAGHPAIGSVTMNMAANMLGLDNAATPMGLKAMRDLQALNAKPDTATDAQILFLVLNTASVTLIPVSVFLYRAQQGAPDPAAIVLPILFATCAGTIAGVGAVAWRQRLPLFDRVVLAYVAGFALLLAALISYLVSSVPSARATCHIRSTSASRCARPNRPTTRSPNVRNQLASASGAAACGRSGWSPHRSRRCASTAARSAGVRASSA